MKVYKRKCEEWAKQVGLGDQAESLEKINKEE
jgi:hypothetical protein